MMNQLNIGGQLYPVVFNLNVAVEFCTLYEIDDMNEMGSILSTEKFTSIANIKKQCNLVLCMLKEGARKEKVQISLTLEDIIAEITNQPDLLLKATKIFIDNTPKVNVTEGEQKKT